MALSEGLLHKADRLGRLLENTFLTVLLLGMIGLAASQIFLRWGGAGSLHWGDEAVRLMVLWIAIIAGVAAAREDRHISIDVLSRFLAPRPRAIAGILVHLFTAAVCLVLARYSYTMVSFAFEDGDMLLGGLPAWWFQLILPVGFLLIGYRYLIWVGRLLLQAFRGEVGK
jgi:TRAP-type C4-dicarboxylate transport system permease small subunit